MMLAVQKIIFRAKLCKKVRTHLKNGVKLLSIPLADFVCNFLWWNGCLFYDGLRVYYTYSNHFCISRLAVYILDNNRTGNFDHRFDQFWPVRPGQDQRVDFHCCFLYKSRGEYWGIFFTPIFLHRKFFIFLHRIVWFFTLIFCYIKICVFLH